MSLPGVESGLTPKFIGTLFWGVIAMMGAMKSFAISKRPTTNAKCALALMCFLVGYGLASIAGGFMLFGVSGWVGAMGVFCAYLVGFVAIIVSVVLAILGLVEIRKQPQAFIQGRAQGLWTLVLTGLFLLIVVGAVSRRILADHGVFESSSPPGQVVQRDDLNFRFTPPGKPWATMSAAKINPDATLAFMRRAPDICFVLIAERFGGDGNLTVNQIAEVGRSQLKSAASVCVERDTGDMTLNGLAGLLVQTDITLYSQDLTYCHWFCVTNGYAFQLIAWGETSRQKDVVAQFKEVAKGFQLADRTRIAPLSGKGFDQDFMSLGYGYKVAVANSAWMKWATLSKDFPQAEFGAERDNCCLAVVPVTFEGVTLERDALIAGLLHTLDITYPSDELLNRTTLAENGMEGVQFSYKRRLKANDFVYRVSVLRGKGVGYLIAAWGVEGKPGLDEILADGVARVQVIGMTNAVMDASSQTGRVAFTWRDLKTQASVMNSAGLYYYKTKEYEKALQLFESAVTADKSDVIYVKNALEAWNRQGKPREALDYLEVYLPAYTNQPELLCWQAYLQGETGQIALSASNFARVFAGGYDSEDDFCAYIRMLLRENRLDEAQKETESYAPRHESTAIRLLQAEVYRARQEFPKAITLLKTQHEKSPHNMHITTELVETQLAAGHCNDALSMCGDLIESGNDSAYVWHLKGRCECGLRWYREAKTSFEAALKRAPANADTKEYLSHVSGLLGEGQNSDIKDRIDPVPLPPEIDGTTKALTGALATDSGAYYLRKIQAVSFDSNKECKTTDYLTIRVLDASGVAAFSTIQSTYNPLGEDVFVNEVRVTDAAGKTVSTGRVSDCYVLDSPGDTVSQKRVLNIPVPGLQVGNEVHVTITRRDAGKLASFPFMEHVLASAYPVHEAILFVRAPASTIRVRASADVKSRTLGEGRCWIQENPPLARYEPLQPTYSSFLPTLWIGDTTSTWPGVASNYLATIRDRLIPDMKVDRLGLSLVAGVGEGDPRIAAIARYVQTNYTYKAIEFGRRAQIPNKPGEIISNKYGDCKDHALLVWHLLRAAGIKACLALVSVNSVVQKDLPSLDQFNHMVVYIPLPNGGQIVDATDKGDALPDPAPHLLLGKDLFILDGQHPSFVTVVKTPDRPPVLRMTRHVKVFPKGDVVVDETLVFGGSYGARWRNGLLDMAPTSRRLILKQQMDIPAAEMDEIQITDLEDPSKPLTICCRYTIKNQFQAVGGRLTGSLHAPMELSALSVPVVEGRLTPFELRSPLGYEAEITVSAPKGFVIAQPSPESVSPSLRFLSWTRTTLRETGSQMKILISARQKPGRFEPGDYALYRAEMNQLLAAVEAQIVFEPGGK